MHRYLSPFHLFPPAGAVALAYVGGVINTGPNNTGATYTQSLSGTLTGGLASSPSTGDFILVASAFTGSINSDDDVTCSGNTTGAYTEVSDLFSNDTNDLNFGVFYTIAGATPDTTLTLVGRPNTNDGSVCCIQVWRPVHATTPLDVTREEATGIDTPNVTFDPITPITAGARVFAIGASTAPPTSIVVHTTSTGYEYKTYALCANTVSRKPRLGIESKLWSGSGSETPGTWTLTDLNTTNHSWAACTLALRPAA